MPKKTAVTLSTESNDAVEQSKPKKVFILRKKSSLSKPPKNLSWNGIIVALERYKGEETQFKDEFKNMLVSEHISCTDSEFEEFSKRTKIMVLNNSYDGEFNDDILSSLYMHKTPPMLDTVFKNIKTSLNDIVSAGKSLSISASGDDQFVVNQQNASSESFPKIILIARRIRNTLLFVYYNATEVAINITEVRKLYTTLVKELVFCQNRYTTFALSQPLGIYEAQSPDQ